MVCPQSAPHGWTSGAGKSSCLRYYPPVAGDGPSEKVSFAELGAFGGEQEATLDTRRPVGMPVQALQDAPAQLEARARVATIAASMDLPIDGG